MIVQEAFELTFSKIKELKDSGISITITPSKSKDDISLVEKYNFPDRLSSKYWCTVSFKSLNKQEILKISETKKYLNILGISFDTGGSYGSRDWELDWSFKYTHGEEDMDSIIAHEMLEELITNNCEKCCQGNCKNNCDI